MSKRVSATNPIYKRYESLPPAFAYRKPREVACPEGDEPRFDAELLEPTTYIEKDSVRICIAGDLLCQEGILDAYRLETREPSGAEYDFTPCFDYIRPLLRSADFAVGNLETPVCGEAPLRGEIITHLGPFYCNAPVEYLDALRYAGFDMLTTANNHAMDAGVRAAFDTNDAMVQRGFIHTGVFTNTIDDRFKVVDIYGFKVGFVAFGTKYNSMEICLNDEGKEVVLNTYSRERAADILQKMIASGAEYTIAFPHWGNEYAKNLSNSQLGIAEELTSMGYDLVAGSHSHVIQRYSEVNDKPVIYCLGNLLSHCIESARTETSFSVICNVMLTRAGSDLTSKITFTPCKIVKKRDDVPFSIVPLLTGVDEGSLEPLEAVCGVDVALNRLEVKDAMIEDASNWVTLAEKKALSSALLRRPAIVGMLDKNRLPEQKMVDTVEDALESISKKVEDRENLIVSRYGLCKRVIDEVELVGFDPNRKIIRPSRTIDGLPLTKIAPLTHEPNEMARIVYIPNSVVEVADDAFSCFSSLESVRFFAGLKVIGNRAFSHNPSISGTLLPDGLTSIGAAAFSDCANLRCIYVPESVVEIGKGSFADCPHLTLYGKSGSFVESFAESEDIPFVALDKTRRKDWCEYG